MLTDSYIGRPWRAERSKRDSNRVVVRPEDGAWMCDFDGEKAQEFAELVVSAVNSRAMACARCSGLGYLVTDAEFAPYPVQCPDCKGATTSPAKRYERLLASFTELQAAAQRVVDETDRIHDSKPWPQKYCAPYGAIVELRQQISG